MYKIIGADGREYGPVTVEQLHQWIREGRANAQTKVQPEGSTDWKPLAEIPEFAPTLQSSGVGPTAPPMVVVVEAEAFAAQILARDYTIDIGSCISRGWELVKKDFWLLVGASFVGGIIASGCCIPYLGILIALIVSGPMMGGLYALYLKKVRGQPAVFGDAFVGFSTCFVPLMLAKLVSGLLTGLGFLLCILPGIYLAVSWVFVLPLVVDKKIEFWPAMELSRKVVTKHWWLMLGFLIVCALVVIAGLLACCIGVLVTSAIAQAALMYAYEDILAPDLPPKILERPTSDKLRRQVAWGFVLSNLVLPGLGTFAAQRRVEGVLQVVVSQTGFVLMVVWTTSFVRMWIHLKNFPEDMGPHAGICFLGLALFFMAWIWSLASSYGILQDSRTSGL